MATAQTAMTEPRKQYRHPRVLASITAAMECYVLAEILWTVINPSGPRLYERIWQLIAWCRDRIKYRLQILATVRSIRRLPDRDRLPDLDRCWKCGSPDHYSEFHK
jgi:hypothetical protein